MSRLAAVLREATQVPNLTRVAMHALAHHMETSPDALPALGRANMALARALRGELATVAKLDAPVLVPNMERPLRAEPDERAVKLAVAFDAALADLVSTDDDVPAVASALGRELASGDNDVASLAKTLSMALHANATRLVSASDATMRLGVLWRGANLERAVGVFKY